MGIETYELNFEKYHISSSALLSGETGHGFPQMMCGLEMGRIRVASCALGLAWAALEDSLAFAQQRGSFVGRSGSTSPSATTLQTW